MKKLLVIAVALASVNAFATRARVNALGNSPHLIDTQTVYGNPADIFALGGDYVTIESGKTNAASSDSSATVLNNGAEGMVVRSMGDAKMGLSLGHDSDVAVSQRNLVGSLFGARVNYYQQNPIELTYGMKSGDMSWAGTLVYSNYKSKTGINEKEDTLGVRGGVRMGALDANVRIGLANNYANDTNGKFKGTLSLAAGAGYQMDSLYFSAFARNSGFKTETAAGVETSKFDIMTIEAKVTSATKKDGTEFFYGAGLESSNVKNSVDSASLPSKVTSLALPIWMGIESEANSWLTLRGSISQKTLIHDSKTEVTNASVTTTSEDVSPGTNSTTVAVGAGLKFNKLTLDGSLEGLSGSTASQQLNGTTLLGTVGLAYMF